MFKFGFPGSGAAKAHQERRLPLLWLGLKQPWHFQNQHWPGVVCSTSEVLFGKENRLQLCGANMQTSTVKGGRIISADGA